MTSKAPVTHNEFWNDRYATEQYVYGTEPNDLLKAEAARIPKGRVLCLADGEGRNGVYLATLGYQVTTVDFSAEGLRKARDLAAAKGVAIETIEGDLATFDLGDGAWAGIVAIWAHTPSLIRKRVHDGVARALELGGVFLLESYRPEQIPLTTGGPKDPDMLPTLASLREELAALDLVIARDVEREIHEGHGHGGASMTVQIVGVRAAVTR